MTKEIITYIDKCINDYSRHLKISSSEVITSLKTIKDMIDVKEIKEIKPTKEIKEVKEVKEETIEQLREQYIEKFNKKPFPWRTKEVLLNKINV